MAQRQRLVTLVPDSWHGARRIRDTVCVPIQSRLSTAGDHCRCHLKDSRTRGVLVLEYGMLALILVEQANDHTPNFSKQEQRMLPPRQLPASHSI
jgi:hypothetical protein